MPPFEASSILGATVRPTKAGGHERMLNNATACSGCLLEEMKDESRLPSGDYAIRSIAPKSRHSDIAAAAHGRDRGKGAIDPMRLTAGLSSLGGSRPAR